MDEAKVGELYTVFRDGTQYIHVAAGGRLFCVDAILLWQWLLDNSELIITDMKHDC